MSKEEQEFNPLDGWTKEQIKSTLKKHTKTELLKIAMQWRIIAEQLQMQLTDMYSDEETDTNADEASDSSLSSSGEADNESEEKTIED